jgi:hypothetical protein
LASKNGFRGKGIDAAVIARSAPLAADEVLFLGWFVYAGVYLAFALATTREAWAFFLAYALFYGLTEPAEKTLVAKLVGWFPPTRRLARKRGDPAVDPGRATGVDSGADAGSA